MAEAPIKWKVETLRSIAAAPAGAEWVPAPDSPDNDWFIDIKKDGYVEASWGTKTPGFLDGNGVYFNLHVTEKGKKLVEDYDSQNTFKGIWKRYHLLILGGILGIVTTLIVTYLTRIYFH